MSSSVSAAVAAVTPAAAVPDNSTLTPTSSSIDAVDLTEVKVFLTFQFAGALGLLAVLLTAIFASRIYRHFTWLNFCITWLIYCVSYTLLALSGQQTRAEEPAFPLCLTQASLIYAAPVLVAMSTFSLVLQLWITLKSALHPPKVRGIGDSIFNAYLLLAPYVAWLGFVVTILVIGTLHPSSVERAGHLVYCTIRGGREGNVTAAVVAGILLIMVVFDVYIGIVLYKNWRSLRGSDHPGAIPLNLLARVALFSLVCVVGIGCAFVFLANVSFFAGNVIISLMPLIAFLVFGTQRDILSVWAFWRKK